MEEGDWQLGGGVWGPIVAALGSPRHVPIGPTGDRHCAGPAQLSVTSNIENTMNSPLQRPSLSFPLDASVSLSVYYILGSQGVDIVDGQAEALSTKLPSTALGCE